jgi:hypothetical protein
MKTKYGFWNWYGLNFSVPSAADTAREKYPEKI